MKILLDECVTKRLKRYLPEFEVFTVIELGISGVKNGKLLKYCIENSFDILLTIDKNINFQQNMEKFPITLVVFDTPKSDIEYLIKYLPSFKSQLKSFAKNKSYLIRI